MKILLTGCDGQVGRALQSSFANNVDLIALRKSELDITNQKDVLECIKDISPDYIVNAAAYTAVDKAETEKEIALNVNSNGPKFLALAAEAINAVLIHISTDYVFDGEKTAEYLEKDRTNPQGVYGKTKLLGENEVLENCQRSLILRTSWVFGEFGNNFVKTMLRLGAEKEELGIVADQYGGPTYAGDIAAAIIKVVDSIESGAIINWGIYHFSGLPHVSWFEFAQEIFKQAESSKMLGNSPILITIDTSAYPTPAKRPSNSRLNCDKISKEFGIQPSDWKQALKNIKNYK